VILILFACVTIAVAAAAYKRVLVSREQGERDSEAKAGSRARVATVTKSKGDRIVSVIGEAKAFANVTLYAKVSGYLKEVRVDKGDVVKTGDILGIIESPETDKSYEGALADALNKNAIAKRAKDLFAKQLVSEQEYDQAISDAKVSQARLEGLQIQKGYEVLRAPFDGTVTARFADGGALVQNAANSQTSSLPVVTISQVNHLRVYAYIDQRDAPFITAGLPATIRLPERPAVELHAKVTRAAGQLDDKTRMLLTEIDLDNKDGQVVAGSFVQVEIGVQTPPLLQVPAAALVSTNDKYFVPVVSSENIMKYREVKVAETDGKFVSLISGVEEGETVALNLGNSLSDGARIRPVIDEVAKSTKPKVTGDEPEKKRHPSGG